MEEKNINTYEVVIVGAGHAGCEAAIASSQMGVKTILISISMDTVALMPCNSAVGGPGRGQIVREIDVLEGIIAKNVDKNYIHSRMLNLSKGPALRTIRSIVDKRRYFLSMKNMIENQPNLDLKQGLVVKIEKKGKGYRVFTSDDCFYDCKSIVISTGTFLRGKIFWGNYELNAGRQGEINSSNLAYCLCKMGYKFSRFRTETPPRVDKKTIDFKSIKVQEFDRIPEMFSYEGFYDGREQISNYITYLNKDCIDFIEKNINKSPIYARNLNSQSPKYCPSIEDKVLRFRNKERHLIFIQPEGKDTNEMYLHGLFTTFSEDMQEQIIRKIKGLENAVLTRPGYGVEYDYLLPYQLNSNLESKNNKNIFFAGQINGTTGYEEAAAQGLLAGINAFFSARELKNVIIEREDGYIGVLIDDVVLKGVSEPYRMLTSRNEYRLYHRHDNADIRMSKFLNKLGHKAKASKILNKYKKIDNAFINLKKSKIFNNKKTIEDIKQDRLSPNEVNSIKRNFNLDDKELESLIINIKYETYLKREYEKINNIKNNIKLEIPKNIDYSKVKNISKEAFESLIKHRPSTVKQASRLEGVRPTDIFSLINNINYK
jgi:tRNA uridine 5-carboxymethylaminomethyl modification enzyme